MIRQKKVHLKKVLAKNRIFQGFRQIYNLKSGVTNPSKQKRHSANSSMPRILVQSSEDGNTTVTDRNYK
jgi:hypothetical protein